MYNNTLFARFSNGKAFRLRRNSISRVAILGDGSEGALIVNPARHPWLHLIVEFDERVCGGKGKAILSASRAADVVRHRLLIFDDGVV
jgi:hypothetical protein